MFRIIADNLAFISWRALGFLIPKRDDYIVLSTYPDFDDTFRALQEAIKARNTKLIVLTRRVHVPPSGACNEGTLVVSAKSLRGVWYYHRSKVVIFTHGLFSRWPPSRLQLVINLWHGTPIKNIGLLDNKRPRDIPKSDYVLAERAAYKEIIAEAFGVDPNRVLVMTHPRIDMLYSRKDSSIRIHNPTKTIVAWLPTYRRSTTGDVREDGNPDEDILLGRFDTQRLDRILEENNAICVVKPHPMAVYQKNVFSKASRIVLLENADLAAEDLTVYEFLASADLLVTDLSSVVFDFTLTGKPALIFFPDRAQYEVNRGLVRPIKEVVDCELVESFEDFFREIANHLGQASINRPKLIDQRKDQKVSKFSNEFLDVVEDLQKRKNEGKL